MTGRIMDEAAKTRPFQLQRVAQHPRRWPGLLLPIQQDSKTTLQPMLQCAEPNQSIEEAPTQTIRGVLRGFNKSRIFWIHQPMKNDLFIQINIYAKPSSHATETAHWCCQHTDSTQPFSPLASQLSLLPFHQPRKQQINYPTPHPNYQSTDSHRPHSSPSYSSSHAAARPRRR